MYGFSTVANVLAKLSRFPTTEMYGANSPGLSKLEFAAYPFTVPTRASEKTNFDTQVLHLFLMGFCLGVLLIAKCVDWEKQAWREQHVCRLDHLFCP